jgi:hypothetical protein
MRRAVDRAKNTANLREMSRLLADLEHFIFFGTLLGYQREGAIIENDDDIDIYVEMSQREKLEDILAASDFSVNFRVRRNRTPYFRQATRVQDRVTTFVDFYLYEVSEDGSYIIERWNFSGQCNNPENAIHIPHNLIFPITQQPFDNFQVNVPADPAGCCAYLYGPSWQSPLKKGSGYQIVIQDNTPTLIPK